MLYFITQSIIFYKIKYCILVFHSAGHNFWTYARNFMIVRNRFKGTMKKNRGCLLNVETPSVELFA